MHSEHSFSQGITLSGSGMSKVFHFIWHQTVDGIYSLYRLPHTGAQGVQIQIVFPHLQHKDSMMISNQCEQLNTA